MCVSELHGQHSRVTLEIAPGSPCTCLVFRAPLAGVQMAVSKLNLKALCVSNLSSCPFQLILSCFTGSCYGGVPCRLCGDRLHREPLRGSLPPLRGPASPGAVPGVPSSSSCPASPGAVTGGSLPPLRGPASPGAITGVPAASAGTGCRVAGRLLVPVNKSSTCSKSQLSCHCPLYSAVASPAEAPSRPHPPRHPPSRLRAVSQEPTCPALHA